MNNRTTIQIERTTRIELKKEKLIVKESYDETIMRLIKYRKDNEEYKRKIRDGELVSIDRD